MESFKKIELEDLEIIKPFFINQHTRICDYSVATRFMWRDFFNQEYIIIDETIIFKIRRNGDTWFEYPLGKNVEQAIKYIENYCEKNCQKLVYGTIPYDYMLELTKRYPDHQLMFDRNWCDYLYDYESFRLHQGKKYNKKRNQVKNFEKNYPNHHLEFITEKNLDQVKEFYNQFMEEFSETSPIAIEEAKQVYCSLNHLSDFNLIGGALFVDNKVVGFSLGEIVNDTLIHHIEKANTNFPGVYQKLVYEYLQLFEDKGISFVNREEDDGDVGLRRSKFSYRPYKLLNKYTIFTKKQDVNINLVSLKKLPKID